MMKNILLASAAMTLCAAAAVAAPHSPLKQGTAATMAAERCDLEAELAAMEGRTPDQTRDECIAAALAANSQPATTHDCNDVFSGSTDAATRAREEENYRVCTENQSIADENHRIQEMEDERQDLENELRDLSGVRGG